jgi:hypothetical protein
MSRKQPTPLRAFLQAEGRRQNWLADQIGKHESEVSRIVGGFIPDAETQEAIASVLGTTVAELWPVVKAEGPLMECVSQRLRRLYRQVAEQEARANLRPCASGVHVSQRRESTAQTVSPVTTKKEVRDGRKHT